MKPQRRIPAVAVRRLPLYLRVLEDLASEGVEVTSSADLANRSGYSSEQIRKDLAYFGAFGTRGLGYDVSQLTQHLRRILGLTAAVPVALVGAGNLGTAWIRYASLGARDTYVAAVFDDATEHWTITLEDGAQARAPRMTPNAATRVRCRAAPSGGGCQRATEKARSSGTSAAKRKRKTLKRASWRPGMWS